MESASRSSFSEEVVEKVWEKAKTIPGSKPELWRKDSCGTKIYRHSYGLQSKFGWEIDHITPKSKGAGDELKNLQPLQWENNRAKGNNTNWSCE